MSSTNPRLMQIGIDRLVRLRWLDKTALLVLAGNEDATIKSALQLELKKHFVSSNSTVRGSIDKTITILLKVWLRTPKSLDSLRLRGLELLGKLSLPERLIIHWGMVSAVYPFWSAVAIQTGRLIKLQGDASAAQVQRRIREQFGERETVSRRARYVLRSFLDWGVLQETEAKGTYSAGAAMAIDDVRLISWLVEASLYTRADGSAPFKDLINGPALFPFRIKQIKAESLLSASANIEVLRHGLDDDLIMLSKAFKKRDT